MHTVVHPDSDNVWSGAEEAVERRLQAAASRAARRAEALAPVRAAQDGSGGWSLTATDLVALSPLIDLQRAVYEASGMASGHAAVRAYERCARAWEAAGKPVIAAEALQIGSEAAQIAAQKAAEVLRAGADGLAGSVICAAVVLDA